MFTVYGVADPSRLTYVLDVNVHPAISTTLPFGKAPTNTRGDAEKDELLMVTVAVYGPLDDGMANAEIVNVLVVVNDVLVMEMLSFVVCSIVVRSIVILAFVTVHPPIVAALVPDPKVGRLVVMAWFEYCPATRGEISSKSTMNKWNMCDELTTTF